jgi:hypothetical protein
VESGWIINYKNDFRVILTEVGYKKYDKRVDKSKIRSEEHWFNIEDAKTKNPNLSVMSHY